MQNQMHACECTGDYEVEATDGTWHATKRRNLGTPPGQVSDRIRSDETRSDLALCFAGADGSWTVQHSHWSFLSLESSCAFRKDVCSMSHLLSSFWFAWDCFGM